MDESRKQFEQFLKDEHHYSDDELFWEEDRNCYSIYPVHIAWKAWEGSRASIEIVLTKPNQGSLPGDYHIGYDSGAESQHESDVEAIRAAGIKVKE